MATVKHTLHCSLEHLNDELKQNQVTLIGKKEEVFIERMRR
jgi:hypothetical protein